MIRARIRVDGRLAAVCRRFWGAPTYPWRGYRTLHLAISIEIKPSRLFPLPLIPCLPDMATSLRWIRGWQLFTI